jgi:DNA-directed RNA polymerase subunit L
MFQNYKFDPKSPTNRHTFEIHNSDVSIVNALRRIILTDIPVVGFMGEEEPSITIVENTGALHNEFIMTRIGLIPVHLTDEETEAYPADPLSIELHVHGDQVKNVTTQHFKVKRGETILNEKETKRMFPSNKISKDYVLITRLRPTEELHLRAECVKSTARKNAGFCPVSLCTFSYMIDEVAAGNTTSVIERERTYRKNEYGDPVAIQFEIESECALTPRYLVSKALEIILEKLDMVQQEVYNPQSEKLQIQQADTGGYNFTFQREDDTLGNLLQSYIHVNHVRTPTETANGEIVKYVGYYCPHPLDETVVVNVSFDSDAPVSSYSEFMASACRQLASKIQEMLNEWVRFAPKD